MLAALPQPLLALNLVGAHGGGAGAAHKVICEAV
jgi:hypothetical protein